MELFMTANVFDCSDVVDEEGIAIKENRYGGMDEQSPMKTWLFLSEGGTTKRGRQPLHVDAAAMPL
jgi:hypothetical protein